LFKGVGQMKLKKMKMKRTLLRIAALALSTTLGFLSLAAAATAIELTPATEQQAQAKTATLSGLNKKMLSDGDNPAGAAVANLIAKQQADEAARKAAEEAAAQQAASQEAATQEAAAVADGENGAPAASNDEGEAWAILSSLISQYPILQGASVSFGDARGYEAVCYYTAGCIVISPSHTYSLGELIYHEAMHLLNYRQSGQTTE
jgi:hypothetical protein